MTNYDTKLRTRQNSYSTGKKGEIKEKCNLDNAFLE